MCAIRYRSYAVTSDISGMHLRCRLLKCTISDNWFKIESLNYEMYMFTTPNVQKPSTIHVPVNHLFKTHPDILKSMFVDAGGPNVCRSRGGSQCCPGWKVLSQYISILILSTHVGHDNNEPSSKITSTRKPHCQE